MVRSPHVVAPGGIDIVHAVIDCVSELAGGTVFIDLAILFRETHTAVAEDGESVSCFWYGAVEHFWCLLWEMGVVVLMGCGGGFGNGNNY